MQRKDDGVCSHKGIRQIVLLPFTLHFFRLKKNNILMFTANLMITEWSCLPKKSLRIWCGVYLSPQWEFFLISPLHAWITINQCFLPTYLCSLAQIYDQQGDELIPPVQVLFQLLLHNVKLLIGEALLISYSLFNPDAVRATCHFDFPKWQMVWPPKDSFLPVLYFLTPFTVWLIITASLPRLEIFNFFPICHLHNHFLSFLASLILTLNTSAS